MELSFLLNIYENDYILLPIATNVFPKIMSFRAPYVCGGEFSYEEKIQDIRNRYCFTFQKAFTASKWVVRFCLRNIQVNLAIFQLWEVDGIEALCTSTYGLQELNESQKQSRTWHFAYILILIAKMDSRIRLLMIDIDHCGYWVITKMESAPDRWRKP